MASTTVRPKKHYLELDKRRPIIFDLNAFAAIEDHGYASTEDAFTAMEQGSMKALRVVLAAVLSSGAGQDVPLDEVGRLITMDNMAGVITALGNCLSDALPADAREKAAKATNRGNASPA